MDQHGIAEVLLACGLVGLASLALRPPAQRLQIPEPLFYLIGGFVLGHWGPAEGVVSARIVGLVGTTALIVILASGGLDCGFRKLRPVLAPVFALGIGSTLAAFALLAVLGHVIAGLPWSAALILGAALAPTDPAAVFSALGGGAASRARITRVLEGEAGFNDPVAIALAIELTNVAASGDTASPTAILRVMVEQGAIGALAGVTLGLGLRRLLGPREPTIHLVPPLALLTAAFATYGATTLLHGSGFVAVYLFALVVIDGPIPEREDTVALFQQLSHVAEIAMFVLLGVALARVGLDGHVLSGLAIGALAVVVVRPVTSYPVLAAFRFDHHEAVFASVAGLKGAVPILLASLPLAAGIPQGGEILAVTAIVVIISLLVQGSAVGRLAARLDLP